ncbi:MAG: hypothetical protein ACR2RB_22270 [Gammaproteobacteria bacterium]
MRASADVTLSQSIVNARMAKTHSVQRTIPADHPSLAGHFPGHPVVPGVVLLDEVVSAYRGMRGPVSLTGAPVVKFIKPLLPEESFLIELREPQPYRVKYECRRDGELVAQGSLNFAAADGV